VTCSNEIELVTPLERRYI